MSWDYATLAHGEIDGGERALGCRVRRGPLAPAFLCAVPFAQCAKAERGRGGLAPRAHCRAEACDRPNVLAASCCDGHSYWPAIAEEPGIFQT